ncbi:MAG: cobalt-precorrin 5A hydrolase [Bacillota bacterium]|nr:cobalt-precorrin 5A hydrolase [Bacillota bacterium]
MNGAVIALTPGGRELALRVAATTGFAVYLPEKLQEAADSANSFLSLPDTLHAAFAEREALVLIMACGIAVRLLAPLLRSKQTDPAVVVMDEAGRFAVSLVSGHWGGANQLAARLGELTGAVPVITTATDVHGLLAIDVFAGEIGARPEPFARVKDFNAAMLRKETVAVFSDITHPEASGLCFYPLIRYKELAPDFAFRALLTNLAVYPGSSEEDLYLRPPNLYVGVGCRRGVAAERIITAIRTVLSRFNLAEGCLAGLASLEAKKDEPGLLLAAEKLNVPVCFYSREDILALQAPVQASAFVQEKMGVKAVCEPAAMLAAGSQRLLVPKQKMDGITVAVAEQKYPWSGLGPAGRKC